MRIIALRTLREYWETHADSEQQLRAWYASTKQANWQTPSDVKQDHKAASFVADNRVVFNIKGNRYRLVVRINYTKQIVYVRFIGTHSAYDKINVVTV